MVKRLIENWFLKLLSLIFALILWFFVMGEQKQEVSYAVPLVLKNIPTGLMVANQVPSQVDVRINGPRTLLMNIRSTDISIGVDLKDLQPGLTSFKRLEERFNLPSALKVTRLSPSYVDVKLERIKAKPVPVKVVLAGLPAAGYELGPVVAVPGKVVVEGAEGELKNINEVKTEAVEIDGVKDSFAIIVPVNYVGTYTVLKEDKTVEVQVTIIPPPSPRPSDSAPTEHIDTGDVIQ